MKRLTFLFLILVLCSGTTLAMQSTDETPAVQPKALEVPDLTADHSVVELQLLVSPLTLEQLQVEAEEWQALVQASMVEVARLKVAALKATGDELAQLHTQINSATERRARLIDQAKMILTSMELKGADPAVISGYRKFVSGALAAELQATDLRTTVNQMAAWAADRHGGISFLISLVSILGALFLLIIVARFVRALASRGVRRLTQVSKLLQDFLLRAIFWLTFAVGLLLALSLFGVNITPLFAILGGASFILAFAMQETLGNLAAGLMIMLNRPFDVGDLVDTNGIIGEVEAVSIVSTKVRTLDNQVVILPNSAVWGSIITNVTVSPIRRVDMVFGIGYGDDIETATRVLEETVRAHPLTLDDPAPNIRVHELGDSSVNFICRPWSKTEDYWTVYWDLTRQVKENFDAAGVTIPFPQRDVHLYQQPDA